MYEGVVRTGICGCLFREISSDGGELDIPTGKFSVSRCLYQESVPNNYRLRNTIRISTIPVNGFHLLLSSLDTECPNAVTP